MATDIVVHYQGRIVMLHGTTAAGRAWIEQHCSDDRFHPVGRDARRCEQRYAKNLIDAATDDGLAVERIAIMLGKPNGTPE